MVSESMMQSEAYKVGLSNGFDHANYAENVEGLIIDEDAAERYSESVTPPGYISEAQYSAYRTGYRDGICDYYESQ